MIATIDNTSFENALAFVVDSFDGCFKIFQLKKLENTIKLIPFVINN